MVFAGKCLSQKRHVLCKKAQIPNFVYLLVSFENPHSWFFFSPCRDNRGVMAPKTQTGERGCHVASLRQRALGREGGLSSVYFEAFRFR